jgi:hypothetical protein
MLSLPENEKTILKQHQYQMFRIEVPNRMTKLEFALLSNRLPAASAQGLLAVTTVTLPLGT